MERIQRSRVSYAQATDHGAGRDNTRKIETDMDNSQRFQARIERLIAKGITVLDTHSPNPPGVVGFPTLDPGFFAHWRTQCVAFLTNLLGAEHTYVVNFEADVDKGYSSRVKAGIGILRAVGEDLRDGFLTDVRTLVSADVFTDFLAMANHLLECDYKDPAASLCGAVLEQGLRRIATNRGVKVREKDDLSALSQKLAATDVYNRLVQKRLAVWTDVRNAADHGRFSDYSMSDVREMHAGISSFLAQHLT